MTFKWKISLMISVVTTIILVVTSFFVYFSFTGITHAHIKQLLDLKLKNLMVNIDNSNFIYETQIKRWEQELDQDQFIEISDDIGEVLYTTKPDDSQILISEEKTTICAETLFFNQGIGNITVRLYQDAKTENKQIELILILLTVGTLGGICVAAVSSYIIAEAMIQPISRIVEMVKQIDVNNLALRLAQPRSKDEIYELTNTFNHLLERVDKGFGLQQQFVADASHELRTPLTVIEGHATMISRWGKNSPAVMEESIQYILQETSRMRHLTNQLLKSAIDMEEHPHAGESTDLIEDIAEIRNQIYNIYRSHKPNIHITLFNADDHIYVKIPKAYLYQILTNVLENAVRYSSDECNIMISVGFDQSFVKVVIQDDGVGITLEDLPHVFDRFYRGDKSRSKEIDGTGLGLPIAKKIIDRFGGLIQIESEKGVGTRVTLQMLVDHSRELSKHVTA